MTASRDWDHEAWVHPTTEREFDKTCNEQQTSITTHSTTNVLYVKNNFTSTDMRMLNYTLQSAIERVKPIDLAVF